MPTHTPDNQVVDLKHPHQEVADERLRREEERLAGYRPQVHVEWRAHEYDMQPKTQRWFLAGAIAAGLLLVIAIWTKNYFFAIMVPLGGFVVYTYAVRAPREMYHAITSRGVQIGGRLFDFDNIASFWIFYEPGGIKHLSLETKHGLLQHVRAPLGEADPVQIRESLLQFVSEREHEESMADVIARVIGF